jgi:hypothetical protein
MRVYEETLAKKNVFAQKYDEKDSRSSSRGWTLHALLPNLNGTELSTSDPSSGVQKRTPGVAVEAEPSTHHHLAAQSQWYRIEYLGSKQWRSEEDSRSRSEGWTLHTLLPNLNDTELSTSDPSSGVQKWTPGVAVEAGPSTHQHLAAQSQWYRIEYLGSKQWR